MKKITAMIDSFFNKYINIIGIGIACIGPLNINDSIILNPPNFYEVKNFEIVAKLKQKFDVPIFLDNDMNASALAEKYFGKAKLLDDFAYVGVTNSIGAEVFTNGMLNYGDCGYSGEIGHITVDINGEKCSCGNFGCLELYASFSAKNKSLPKSERLKKLEEKCKYLVVGLTTLINLFDPKVIYIGHDISVFGKEAEEILNNQLAGRYISSGYKNIRVEQSKFGEDAPLYGSIALCIDKMFL
jgi:predicted NBD/HSP70 family sugar kinase